VNWRTRRIGPSPWPSQYCTLVAALLASEFSLFLFGFIGWNFHGGKRFGIWRFLLKLIYNKKWEGKIQPLRSWSYRKTIIWDGKSILTKARRSVFIDLKDFSVWPFFSKFSNFSMQINFIFFSNSILSYIFSIDIKMIVRRSSKLRL
jgi:hypothetical protein